MKKIIFIISFLFIFIIFNYSIYQKEQLKANGKPVFLELAPADPRSHMQGDYMYLNFALVENQDYSKIKKSGYIVIEPNQLNIAVFKRFHDGSPLSVSEKLLHYQNRYGRISIVPDSFMFQEGYAKFYRNAKYGVFKFDNKNNYILVGLADEKFQLIEPY